MGGGKGKFWPGCGPHWVPAPMGAGGDGGVGGTVRVSGALACAALLWALGGVPEPPGGPMGGGRGSVLLRGAAEAAPSGSSPVLRPVLDRGLSGSSWGGDASKLPGDGRVRRGMSSMFKRSVCWVGVAPVLTSPFARLWAFWVSSQLRAAPGSDCSDCSEHCDDVRWTRGGVLPWAVCAVDGSGLARGGVACSGGSGVGGGGWCTGGIGWAVVGSCQMTSRGLALPTWSAHWRAAKRGIGSVKGAALSRWTVGWTGWAGWWRRSGARSDGRPALCNWAMGAASRIPLPGWAASAVSSGCATAGSLLRSSA